MITTPQTNDQSMTPMDYSQQQQQQQPSFLDRIKQYFFGIPLFTRTIFVLCVTIFLIQCIFDWPHVETFCFLYVVIIRYPLLNLYRMVTFFVFHLNVLHIAFNMMALMSLGCMLEMKLGTIHMTFSTFIIAFITTMLQFVIEAMLFSVLALNFYHPSCSAGYSGILFAYMVLSAHYEPVNRSLFGALSISAKFYPWVLLLITSIIFPGVSFLGHLCGMLAGYLFIATILYRDFYRNTISWTEKKLPSFITGMKSFYYSSFQDLENQTQSPSGNIMDSISNASQWVRQRVTGYTPLSQSPNDSSQPMYWDGIGQGRTLGSQ
jgi:membrane associated rhomboid family serine protease